MLTITIIIVALFYYPRPILALAKDSAGEDSANLLFHWYFEIFLAKIIFKNFNFQVKFSRKLMRKSKLEASLKSL